MARTKKAAGDAALDQLVAETEEELRDLPLYLTEHEVARLLRVSARSIQRSRERGDGPEYLRLRGAVRYSRLAVLQWIQARTFKATCQASEAAATA